MGQAQISAKQISGLSSYGVTLDETVQVIQGGKTFLEYDSGSQTAPAVTRTNASRSAGRFATTQVSVASGGLFPTVAVFGRTAAQLTSSGLSSGEVFIGATRDAHFAWYERTAVINNDAGYMVVGALAGGLSASSTRQIATDRSTWLKAGLSSDYLHVPRFNANPASLPAAPGVNENVIYTADDSILALASPALTGPIGYQPLAVSFLSTGSIQTTDVLMTLELTKSGFYSKEDGLLIQSDGVGSGAPALQQFVFTGKTLQLLGTVEVFDFAAYVTTFQAAIYQDPNPSYGLVIPDRISVVKTSNVPRSDFRSAGETWGVVQGEIPAASTDVAQVWRQRREADEETKNLKGYLDYVAVGLSDVPMQEVLFSDRVDGKYIHRYATEQGLARWTTSVFHEDIDSGNGLLPSDPDVGYDNSNDPPETWGTSIEMTFSGAHAVQFTSLGLNTSSGLSATGKLRVQIMNVNPATNPDSRIAGLIADIVVDLAERPSGDTYVDLIGPVSNVAALTAVGAATGPITIPRNGDGLTVYFRLSATVDPAGWADVKIVGDYIHFGGEQRSFAAAEALPATPTNQTLSNVANDTATAGDPTN